MFITNFPNRQMSNRFWQPLLTSAQQFVITWFVIRSCTIVHYSYEFFHISLTLVVLFLCSALLCVLVYVFTFFMLHFICYLFMVTCFSALLPIVSVFTMSYYFHIAVYCFHVVFFFISYFFYFFIFLSSLISFHVAVFSYSTFLCSTFFMLHF